MGLGDLIQVSVSRETSAIPAADYSLIGILGKNLNSSNRYEYVSLSDLSAAAALLIGGTTSEEYKALAAMAENVNPPAQAMLLKLQAPVIVTDNAGTFTAGTIIYTVNGQAVSQAFSTSKDNTLTALATAIQALTEVETATYNAGAHTLTITPATGYVLSVTTNLTGITGTMTVASSVGALMETETDGLNAIALQNNDFYGLIYTNRVKANVKLVSDWAEVNNKLFFTSSDDTVVGSVNYTTEEGYNDATKTVPAYAKAKTRDRTSFVWSNEADTNYPDASEAANLLARTPGSYTAMYKIIKGITPDAWTPTQQTNALGKNASLIQTYGGKNILRGGLVGSGEKIEIIHFIDWLIQEIQIEVFRALSTPDMVPYTPEGLVIVRSALDRALSRGQDNGGISPLNFDADGIQNGGYIITMPNYDTIPANDKAQSILRNVKWRAYLSGAIHYVVINGVVTY